MGIIGCVLCGLTVTGPDRTPVFFGFMALFGTLVGWANPSMRMLYISLMPKGQEAEFMGIYMFVTVGFMWMFPSIFTFLNEQGVRMNIIMICASIPFIIALTMLMTLGTNDDIMKLVQELEREKAKEEIELSMTSEIDMVKSSDLENAP